MSFPIEHRAKLPFGYVATFRWDGASITVEWDPDVPHAVTHPRARRRLLQAYSEARTVFNTKLASELGMEVLTIDLDGSVSVSVPRGVLQ